MFNRKQSFSVKDTISLSGWLFADLLLGLSMLFLVFNTVGSDQPLNTGVGKDGTIIPSLTATTKPTITPIPTKKPTPLGADLGLPGLSAAQCYNIQLNSRDVRSQIKEIQEFALKSLPNQKSISAGLYLIWAHSDSMTDGVRLAREVGQIIFQTLPNSFSTAETKSLYFESGPLYHIQLEIYFFTNAPWKSGNEVPCEYTK